MAKWRLVAWSIEGLPFLAGTAMSPTQKETKTGTHDTEKYQRRKSHRERGEGAEEDGLKKSCAMGDAAQRKMSTPLNHMKVLQE